jgi:Cytochrome P460
MTWRHLLKASAALVPLLLVAASSQSQQQASRYTGDGKLIPPTEYRSWIFLTSGLDMNGAGPPGKDGHLLDNVFVNPIAWLGFQATGHWPDGTVFVQEDRLAKTEGSINKNGFYQAPEVVAIQYHVRDEQRFPGGWAFFLAQKDGPAELIPPSADCYACHQAHGAAETTFTQFYPTAKPIAAKAGTLQEGK